MTHDEDFGNLENPDREFHRGTGAVIISVRRIGRHQIGNVPYDKQLARTGIEDHAGVDTAVGTGNHQRARLLTLVGQGLELPPALRPAVAAEAPIAIQ